MTYQLFAVVSRKIFLADLNKNPKSILRDKTRKISIKKTYKTEA